MTNKYYDYLEKLRDSGVTNMWGSPLYLEQEFKLSKEESKKIFLDWIDTFKGEK